MTILGRLNASNRKIEDRVDRRMVRGRKAHRFGSGFQNVSDSFHLLSRAPLGVGLPA
jgi:hypothetical protein